MLAATVLLGSGDGVGDAGAENGTGCCPKWRGGG